MGREVSESSLVSPRPTGTQGTSTHAGATRTDPWGAAQQWANGNRSTRAAETGAVWSGRLRGHRAGESGDQQDLRRIRAVWKSELLDDSGSVPGREAPATAREERRHVM